MMLRVLQVEVFKLRRSLAFPLLLVVPALLGILSFVIGFAAPKPPVWSTLFHDLILPLWALFLLPMSLAAFSTLVGQIEYRNRGWDHFLTLPIPRWQIFLAKALLVVASAYLMTVLVIPMVVLGGLTSTSVFETSIGGELPGAQLVETMLELATSASAMAVLQTWAALRFPSFVAPIALGMSGTLVNLAATIARTNKADWIPWMMPVRVAQDVHSSHYAAVGAAIACASLVMMLGSLDQHKFK